MVWPAGSGPLAAPPTFDYRLPELYGGDVRTDPGHGRQWPAVGLLAVCRLALGAGALDLDVGRLTAERGSG